MWRQAVPLFETPAKGTNMKTSIGSGLLLCTLLCPSPGAPWAAITGPAGDAREAATQTRTGRQEEEEEDEDEDETKVGEPREAARGRDQRGFTSEFHEDVADLASSGTNPFFVLEPGYVLVLEREWSGRKASITITVLEETREIAGVETRAVEEKETVDGEVREVTRDYYAISKRTNNVYYFGEEVDEYEDGKLAGHSGSWMAGVDGASYGLAMPGSPLLGARYQQENAPGRAMDRGEVVSLSESFDSPAGHFDHVLMIEEWNPLDHDHEYKRYARGVGLIQDEGMALVRHGR
jgi:hypothetical protein